MQIRLVKYKEIESFQTNCDFTKHQIIYIMINNFYKNVRPLYY